MSTVTRECPRCEQLLDAASLTCPECGVEVPADLRVVRGTTKAADLRPTSLLVGLAGGVVMVYIFLFLMLSMLGLLGRLGSRLNTIEQIGFVAVLIALPGFLALLLIVRMPSRVRAIAGDRMLKECERWAWTADRVWRTVDAFPADAETLGAKDSMTATWKRGVVRLELVRLGGRVRSTLWIEGSEADANAIRAALPSASRTA
jgi:hypothetical protein